MTSINFRPAFCLYGRKDRYAHAQYKTNMVLRILSKSSSRLHRHLQYTTDNKKFKNLNSECVDYEYKKQYFKSIYVNVGTEHHGVWHFL
jgi:hypothetical protein